ncbi:MAG: bifunctional histidinol-phosphatase/imidazoleglycerol-phosphate dehydratase HisB [Bacteroidota bacterium]|jgi:imidazoleglycerol-phosphate dehydratase/histidinol-phosphatase
MKKILFIDRDGTLIVEPPSDFQVDSLEKLEFIPGVFQHLSRIVQELEYELVMVSNQDGLGTSSFPEVDFWPAQQKMIQAFKNEGIEFKEILIDRSFPEEQSPGRKPGTAMLTHYLYGACDLAKSFVIGDRLTDVQLAKNMACGSIFIGNSTCSEADLSVKTWEEIYQFLKARPRTAVLERSTKETQISVQLNLDGSGKSNLETGIPFFDHMLEQVAKHAQVDLSIHAEGDLEIDEHHTIEDVAITLGAAFQQALGDKKGIERYGFLLPMDDVLAQVAIDFGGRPWLVWDAEFKREKVGEMPTEMFFHFFKSFSDHAKCNLNIKAKGLNEHHKIEAIFKAFAKALKMAIAPSGANSIPSTKGSL